MKVVRNKPIKSMTNDGDLAKQYTVLVVDNDPHEPSIVIHKLVLTSNYDFYLNNPHGYKLLRVFKGKCLVQTWFSIKLSTFYKVGDWIESVILDEPVE